MEVEKAAWQWNSGFVATPARNRVSRWGLASRLRAPALGFPSAVKLPHAGLAGTGTGRLGLPSRTPVVVLPLFSGF